MEAIRRRIFPMRNIRRIRYPPSIMFAPIRDGWAIPQTVPASCNYMFGRTTWRPRILSHQGSGGDQKWWLLLSSLLSHNIIFNLPRRPISPIHFSRQRHSQSFFQRAAQASRRETHSPNLSAYSALRHSSSWTPNRRRLRPRTSTRSLPPLAMGVSQAASPSTLKRTRSCCDALIGASCLL